MTTPERTETKGQADRGLPFAVRALLERAAAGGLGLAVSGGGDSMALLHLVAEALAQWPAGVPRPRVEVATVDHCLRPESAEELAFVARTAARLGLAHEGLVWRDHPVRGNLMQAGSEARYRLLAGWAGRRGLSHVALAHTADDQAETFLMALARGSGLDGLSGMRPEWEERGVIFHRPLLGFGREALRDYLRGHGHDWCEDPSNENPRYSRARVRRALRDLAPLGITVERLNEAIGNLAATQHALLAAVSERFGRIGHEAHGAIFLDPAGFAGAGEEVQRRLLTASIRWLSGARHPPRADGVERLRRALLAGQEATLGGCRFRPLPKQGLRISREPRAVSAPLVGPLAPGAVWDHRWRSEAALDSGEWFGALGREGLRQIRAAGPAEEGRTIPAQLLEVSPALWRGERLLAAPLAGFGRKWPVSLVRSFDAFLLSH